MNFQNYFLNKKNLKLPRIIFLVGAPASGKSDLAEIIKSEFPLYKILNDLDELKRIAQIEKNKTQYRIKFFPSGGFDIIDPEVWDEILIRTASKMLPQNFYIFEFSRGLDFKYLVRFKLLPEQIYKHCFRLIFTANPESKFKDALIIHMKCDFFTRLKRNQKRKENNEHFVAEEVMQIVYFKDIFHYKTEGSNYGYFNDSIRIPVYSINNSKELALTERKEYFKIEIYKALKFYALSKVN